MTKKTLEQLLKKKGFIRCNREQLDDDFIYRGVSSLETIKCIKSGHAMPSSTRDLIGKDWEVLEFAFSSAWEGEDWSDDEIEKYLDKIIPKWAKREGVNTTTDFYNAKGYAESSKGKILVFENPSDDYFKAGEYHVQVRNAKRLRLIGVCDANKPICYCKKKK